jgi:hypothetical protein
MLGDNRGDEVSIGDIAAVEDPAGREDIRTADQRVKDYRRVPPKSKTTTNRMSDLGQVN